ncbi:hypothetical protein GOBAR_AA40338 [Gossypium barbadense]|uniref:Myb-like domain-containing protein n=1 Tax=Gossypium barbadense TaxID=3634 RepID=A0A2P5VNE8_GOSBA|nr:hypothetical protein GOBAR_AA40338 [Gossypium barbadense]
MKKESFEWQRRGPIREREERRWEENKLFELALAVVDEQHPDRWEVVAGMVGGEKTAEDVHKHYVILLEDLQFIESGKLDHKLAETQSCIQLDCTQSVCWTDDDSKCLPIPKSTLRYQELDFIKYQYFEAKNTQNLE